MAKQDSIFTLERRKGIAIVWLDIVGESMNVLNRDVIDHFPALLNKLEKDKKLSGVVIASGKDDSFIAGADVKMLDACENEEQVIELSLLGHQLCEQLEKLPVPVVAAIHGACLGGGLELALACDYRICSDADNSQMALPEVQLGLLPGSGGTQRLPRLVGIQRALDMMLTGKKLRPKQAKRAGLVDDIVPASILVDTAIKFIDKGKRKRTKPSANLMGVLLERNPLGRNVLFNAAKKQVLAKTMGNYPAPLKIIQTIKDGFSLSKKKAYANEASRFAELVMSPESKELRNIFFATTQMKKEVEVAGEKPAEINKAGVLGGGLMGGGIAYVTIKNTDLPVRIKDINHQGISNALSYSYDRLNRQVKRRFMRKSQMQKKMSLLTGTTDYSGFSSADIVVEAVFEDLDLKRQMVKDVEANCSEKTVFATNTSSIPITQIAKGAKRPENVVGLHYFSPVDKMPLVEIIAHAKTSAKTIATTCEFARKQGKTPVVVKDEAGFFVNRILAPYINEVAYLLLEGEPIEKIDKALLEFGFPVGPLTLLDEVGIDIATKVAKILTKELGERFTPPEILDKFLEEKRLGRKTHKGFYVYSSKSSKKKKPVDEKVYDLIGVKPDPKLSNEQIARRCILPLLNEASRCLDEKVVASARDGDIASIFGIGFPPFLGGPYRYMHALGLADVVDGLTELEQKFGERFRPSKALIDMDESQKSYYSDNKA